MMQTIPNGCPTPTNAAVDGFCKTCPTPCYLSDSIGLFMQYYEALHHRDGWQRLDLTHSQLSALTYLNNNRFVMLKGPRQCGITSLLNMYVLHFALTHPHSVTALINANERQAQSQLKSISDSFKRLDGNPAWPINAHTDNRNELYLSNDAYIRTATATSDSLRGQCVSLYVVDNCSYIADHRWQEFWECNWPVIQAMRSSQIILANNYDRWMDRPPNHFHRLWDTPNRFSKFELE